MEVLTHVTHVSGWEPAVCMSNMSQNFRLFHVSNLSVLNFYIFLLMYPWSLNGFVRRNEPAMNERCDEARRASFSGRRVVSCCGTLSLLGEAILATRELCCHVQTLNFRKL